MQKCLYCGNVFMTENVRLSLSSMFCLRLMGAFCGVPDIWHFGKGPRNRRFVLSSATILEGLCVFVLIMSPNCRDWIQYSVSPPFTFSCPQAQFTVCTFYLTSPQLEVFSFVVAVVGPQQRKDVRPEKMHKHKRQISANSSQTIETMGTFNTCNCHFHFCS